MSLVSARANLLDCVISYFFQLYLILHVYIRKFDVTDTVEKILGSEGARARPGHFFTEKTEPNRTGPNRTELSVFRFFRFGFGLDF